MTTAQSRSLTDDLSTRSFSRIFCYRPALRHGWAARRNARFHRFKLQSCHSLIDRAEFMSGKSGMCGEEMIEMAADDAVSVSRA